MSKLKDERVDFLFRAILSLKDEEECYRFFEDLCTLTEVREMAKRMHAARMLYHGEIYTAVGEATGLSTATISRVSRCIKDGNDGYTAVLARLEAEEQGKTDNG